MYTWDDVPSCLVLKCDDEKSYNDFFTRKKNWISDFTRRAWTIPTQEQRNGIGSWVEMGKVAEEEDDTLQK